jgi:hypothetical protein
MDLERLMRINPRPLVAGAAAISALLLVVVSAATIGSEVPRGASLAAAAAFVLLVAVGVYLYSWPLGAPGRSE